MKFLLLVCVDESIGVDPAQSAIEPWLEEVERRGVRLEGHQLRQRRGWNWSRRSRPAARSPGTTCCQ